MTMVTNLTMAQQRTLTRLLMIPIKSPLDKNSLHLRSTLTMMKIMAPMNTSLKSYSKPKRLILTHTLAINNNRRRRSWSLDNAATFTRRSQLRLTLLALVATPMCQAMMQVTLTSPKKKLIIHHMSNKILSLILPKQLLQLVHQPFSVT